VTVAVDAPTAYPVSLPSVTVTFSVLSTVVSAKGSSGTLMLAAPAGIVTVPTRAG
jgi:hypothetical protein